MLNVNSTNPDGSTVELVVSVVIIVYLLFDDTAVVKCYKPVEEVIEEPAGDVGDDEGTTEDSKDAKANESDSSDDKTENKQDNKE